MSDVDGAVTLERLMSNTGWLRRLAGGLLRDSDAAEDVVQDTLLTALRRPPDGRGSLRGWLGAVLANRIRTGARGDRRRQRAIGEAARAPAEAVATPEEVVARLELQRLVASVLVELPEAQRQVIYLRYFADLASPVIALRLGVPAGTVRWRLKEGLNSLRARLDASDDESGGRWRRILVPLLPATGVRRGPASPRSSLPALAVATSVVVLAGGLGVVVRRASRSPGPTAPPSSTIHVAVAEEGKFAERRAPTTRPTSSSSPSGRRSDHVTDGRADGAVGALAPFSGLRWSGDRAEVEVGDRWAQLLAIDDLPIESIVARCQARFPGSLWRKRIAEDLVEVLSEMGRAPGMTVALTLRDLDDGRVSVLPEAMTRENRQRVYRRDHADAAPAVTTPLDRFARVSPFSGLRYRGDEIEVALDDAWYRLTALNGVPVERLVAFAREHYGGAWRKRIAEDIVEVLGDLGAPVVNLRVDVVLEDSSGHRRNVDGVELTEQNRRRVKETWEMASRG